MANLHTVLKDLDKFVDGLIVELSMDVVANLIETNPVDTGWSRANWIPSIGNPVEEPFASKQTVSNSAQQAGTAKLLTYTRDKGTIFIANNVPYIGILNENASKPYHGFVQRAIIKAISEIGR